ncbi:phenylalanine--tRNA ligase beta subunit-related protein [Halocatena salina]|uniref:B3/B4 tRNA-binding domain-containing protein n=1 Tax=Halocatena salina TaxID=2934340 RepID=A0A8U0A1N3_9EURY|nr:phenylalanine--tRNA ligase beta subunit-related protein [Halocatena salina]UPM43091.1 hypothetical protein MW046_01255 [Halocatena salina]
MDSINEIVIHGDAHKLGINPVGCVIRNLDIQSETNELDDEIRAVEKQLTNDAESVLQSQDVVGSRELFSRLGYPEQEPAGEQLVTLIETSGLNRHNHVVDAYNIVGGRSGAVMGMHDTAQLGEKITVRRADGGETMLPIFHDEPETASNGDLIWESEEDVLALLGPISRDADAFKVTESTEEVLLMIPGNDKTSEEHNRRLCIQTFDLIEQVNPDAELEFIDVKKPALH